LVLFFGVEEEYMVGKVGVFMEWIRGY